MRKYCRERNIKPGLAVIVVGDNPASQTYVNNKKKACDEVGFHSEVLHLSQTSSTKDVVTAVENFCKREDIHGVMVQLPLPKHICTSDVIAAIEPSKDVDALTPTNIGKVMIGDYDFAPCTPTGVIAILDDIGCKIEGSNCVVIGRSDIVGKPMAAMLTNRNATVTLCHSKTNNLADITKRADIIICAVGKAGFLTADMISSNAVVIDVGINRTQEGKLVGDVCFSDVLNKAKAVTRVPGGVGVMTVTSLLENTYKAALLAKNSRRKLC